MSSSPEDQIASPEIHKKIVRILESNGIFDQVDKVLLTEPAVLKGEQMGSKPYYVSIRFTDRSKAPKELFLKGFGTNEENTALLKRLRVMEKESVFFNKFLPEAQRLCEEYELENMLNFPKCLHADEERIVLENVVLAEKFVMLSRTELQDLHTAKLVLSNLAKFHAVSYKLLDQIGRPAFESKFEPIAHESLFSKSANLYPALFDNGLTTCINILKGHPVEGSEKAIEIMVNFIGQAFPITVKSVEISPEDKIVVLNHGDCWNNNMLFKIDPQSRQATHQLFVDLQVTRLGSPNLDIGQFLFTSVKPQVRRAHLKALLLHYFETFKNCLADFGQQCPGTFDDFFEDFRQKCKIGYFLNLVFTVVGDAMRDINAEKMSGNVQDTVELFKTAFANWVSKHPEQAGAIASEIVAAVNEY